MGIIKKRLAKALLYRGIRWITNMLIFWAFTGNLITANVLTLITEVIATVSYILYDKFWDDVIEKKEK